MRDPPAPFAFRLGRPVQNAQSGHQLSEFDSFGLELYNTVPPVFPFCFVGEKNDIEIVSIIRPISSSDCDGFLTDFSSWLTKPNDTSNSTTC